MRGWLLFLAMLIPCLAVAGPPQRSYRITGVAINTRDGSPIPYCRMQATAANSGALTGQDQARGMRGNQGGGFVRGGFEGGGGRRETPSADGTTADAHGRFALDVPGSGAWRVTGIARGFRRQDYDAHDGFFSSIVLTSAAPAMEIVFRMSPDSEITGLVTDEANEPVEHAQVSAETVSTSLGTPPRPVGFGQTDDRGRYEITGLPPGSYRLRVQAQPWFAQAGRQRFGARQPATPNNDPSLDLVFPTVWFPGTDDETAAQPIVLTGGEDRQADFHLGSIPASHLRVPVTPASPEAAGDRQPRRGPGISVTRVGQADVFGQTMTTTSTSGDYDIGGLTPGTYEVRTTGGDDSAAGDVRQIQILPGSAGIVDMTAARKLIKVTIQVDGTADERVDGPIFTETTTGRVTTADRDLMRRMGMNRRDGDPDKPRERTVYLIPGVYRVNLSAYSTAFLTGMTAVGAKVSGMTLEVGDNPVSLTLQAGTGKAEVDGVARLDGQAAAGAMVLLVPATLGEPGNAAEIQRDQTNTDGSFALRNVIPGRYILLAIANGWNLNWRDVGTLAPYLLHGVPLDLAPAAHAKQELTAQKP